MPHRSAFPAAMEVLLLGVQRGRWAVGALVLGAACTPGRTRGWGSCHCPAPPGRRAPARRCSARPRRAGMGSPLGRCQHHKAFSTSQICTGCFRRWVPRHSVQGPRRVCRHPQAKPAAAAAAGTRGSLGLVRRLCGNGVSSPARGARGPLQRGYPGPPAPWGRLPAAGAHWERGCLQGGRRGDGEWGHQHTVGHPWLMQG